MALCDRQGGQPSLQANPSNPLTPSRESSVCLSSQARGSSVSAAAPSAHCSSLLSSPIGSPIGSVCIDAALQVPYFQVGDSLPAQALPVYKLRPATNGQVLTIPDDMNSAVVIDCPTCLVRGSIGGDDDMATTTQAIGGSLVISTCRMPHCAVLPLRRRQRSPATISLTKPSYLCARCMDASCAPLSVQATATASGETTRACWAPGLSRLTRSV